MNEGMFFKGRNYLYVLTSKMNARASSQVATDKLPQVVGGSLLPEPVHEPPGLMSHQDNLILRPHTLLCNSGKIPAKQARAFMIAPIRALTTTLGWFGVDCTIQTRQGLKESYEPASLRACATRTTDILLTVSRVFMQIYSPLKMRTTQIQAMLTACNFCYSAIRDKIQAVNDI